MRNGKKTHMAEPQEREKTVPNEEFTGEQLKLIAQCPTCTARLLKPLIEIWKIWYLKVWPRIIPCLMRFEAWPIQEIIYVEIFRAPFITHGVCMLVFYCGITNHSKTQWPKTSIMMIFITTSHHFSGLGFENSGGQFLLRVSLKVAVYDSESFMVWRLNGGWRIHPPAYSELYVHSYSCQVWRFTWLSQAGWGLVSWCLSMLSILMVWQLSSPGMSNLRWRWELQCLLWLKLEGHERHLCMIKT